MDEFEFRIAKLELQRGDVLVVKGDCVPMPDLMRQLLPDGVRVLYIPNDIELSVMTKAEIEAKAAA